MTPLCFVYRKFSEIEKYSESQMKLAENTDNEREAELYFYHSDHLGSSSFITNAMGSATQHLQYLPFGELFVEQRDDAKYYTPYKFSGKEKDDETSYSYFGARYYDSDLSIWLSVDPLAGKYPSISSYNYCLNNPIIIKDPDGEEVIMWFNKTTGQLGVLDLDHYKKGLPTKFVSAKDYVMGGIRDKDGNLTYNQVLVLDDVFSGGKADSDGNLTRNLEKDVDQIPIPNGSYDLTEYENNSEWFKVDPIDESRYDDNHQGYTNADGTTRFGYRLHRGTLSHGCITICDPKSKRDYEWSIVKTILKNTSKTEVPKREGNQKYVPFTYRLKYGIVIVSGKDNIKEIKKK